MAQRKLQQVSNKNFAVIWFTVSKLSGIRSAVLLSPNSKSHLRTLQDFSHKPSTQTEWLTVSKSTIDLLRPTGESAIQETSRSVCSPNLWFQWVLAPRSEVR